MANAISLVVVKRTHPSVIELMPRHYSQPKGFVGRNIVYLVFARGELFGATVAGSATRFLPKRNQFLGVSLETLNSVVNNTFYHIERSGSGYPIRNFASAVVAAWRESVTKDWREKYGDAVAGFETLVELPRTGECYRRDGWQMIGRTLGYTCKRTAGKGTDSWSGKRVWDTSNLRPKLVFARRIG
jgi:hypothetical protein